MNEDRSKANDAGRPDWHLLSVLPQSSSGELLARAETVAESPWFSGHFPGEPILPGIAQIAMVLETIRRAEGRDVCIAGLKRVRFKQVIEPGDEITIRVRPRESGDDCYSFQVTVGGEIACSGLITVTEAPGGVSCA